MYNLDYIDESVVDNAKKQFSRIYPEFFSFPIGIGQDKKAVIMECEFPDGVFYFRVEDNSVSSSYNSKEDADRE